MKESDKKNSVLIIDDTVDNIKMLAEVLKPFYTVCFAIDGFKGIELAKTENPDLIILDILMEPMDGYEVCKQLKSDGETSEIPVIFLTAVSEYIDEAKGFEIGGVDYITKPFVPMVVLARIRNQVKLSDSMKELKRLYSLALDSNPITRLPGNNSIRNHVSSLIENREKRSVFYVDLDNFKAYNDVYGFASGDGVILALSEIMKKTAADLKADEIFIGHIGGDDFVLTLPNLVAQDYISEFIKNFDKTIREHYTAEDLKRGNIRTKDRKEKTINFPIITVSIAGINLEKKDYMNYLHLSDTCAALKHKAKQQDISICLMDRKGIRHSINRERLNMYRTKKCDVSDIWRIRDFLVKTYQTEPENGNWLIDRLNFSFAVPRVLNELSEEEYCEKIMIWEKDGEIAAVANAEGEKRGEAFFQLSDFDPEPSMLHEMFDFVESKLMREEKGRKMLYLSINEYATKIIKMAEKRGYKKEDWSEITSKKEIQRKNTITLPEGYTIKTARETTCEDRAICHSLAFGYNDSKELVKRSVLAQKQLQNMKDYRPDFDIQVVDKDKTVVAFANMWFDEVNKFGVLEPVGTHPDHRKRGLAKAAIYYAENLISDLGATHVYVGSDQEFYKRIGFYKAEEDYIYKLEKF